MAKLKEIRSSLAYNLLPRREKNSHKGQNGRVMIVGGSIDYYGAPVLAGLGALYSGADLVYLYVPECNFDVTRSLYGDFIVKKYPGNFLQLDSVEKIIEFGREFADSIVIGPGLSDHEESAEAVLKILENLHIPTVLDAQAIGVLKKLEKFPLEQTLVITPHTNEFNSLIDREVTVDENDPQSIIFLRSLAMDLHMNVILKGSTDYVASESGDVELNRTGNPGMTVGGSGDVLAGLAGTLLAQGLEGFNAARAAAFFNGKSGDLLQKQKGHRFTATEIAMSLPFVMR